jgi:hypothetical protein
MSARFGRGHKVLKANGPVYSMHGAFTPHAVCSELSANEISISRCDVLAEARVARSPSVEKSVRAMKDAIRMSAVMLRSEIVNLINDFMAPINDHGDAGPSVTRLSRSIRS